VEALAYVEHHRAETIVVVAIWLVLAVLRTNLTACAISASLLLGVALLGMTLPGLGVALGRVRAAHDIVLCHLDRVARTPGRAAARGPRARPPRPLRAGRTGR
jgi:hypothetical protein